MRKNDVYCSWGIASLIAERVERVSVNDKPIKVLFITDDEIVAEFYIEHTAGWVERKEE